MRYVPILGFLAVITSCGPGEQTNPQPAPSTSAASSSSNTVSTPIPSDAARARAELIPVTDGDVEGTVEFTRLNSGVRVVALVQGLDDGLFGFHIHEGSSCEDPGEHFNPGEARHGDPARPPNMHHAGDLGNVRSERNRARYDRIDKVLHMDGANSIVGRVAALHLMQDDLNSQPNGNSGALAACGIIEGR